MNTLTPIRALAVTIADAARMLGISKRTYYREADAGRLPRWVKIGGRSVVLVEELEAAARRLKGERAQ